jgi:hypothetical protein
MHRERREGRKWKLLNRKAGEEMHLATEDTECSERGEKEEDGE